MRLDIVVTPNCPCCEEARMLAEHVQDRLPGVDVSLLELDGRDPPPANVVATPTYLLDDAVLFLGNPHLEQLVHEIVRRLV